jgi:hypothetical protein
MLLKNLGIFWVSTTTILGGFLLIANQLRPNTNPIEQLLTGPLPAPTPLSATPRTNFMPTTRKGYWNIDVIGDFALPATKSITFCAAGRNLHVQQDWRKLFRRGFSAIEQTRMVQGQERIDGSTISPGWKSRLTQYQRALIIYRGYFDAPFNLTWSSDPEKAAQTWYARPNNAPNARNSMLSAATELSGGCVGFGDCPPTGQKSTFGLIFLDIENDGTSTDNRQEHANLYTFMMKTLRDNVSPNTLIGSITPVPHNGFGYAKAEGYEAPAEWLWNTPARHTATSRQRGMTDAILGKSFSDYADFQMPGTYYLYPEMDYSQEHNRNESRHWLAALLAEQEINQKLSPKKRIAWHWLFNQQNGNFANSGRAIHPAPPAIAEGTAIFYWFTGAYGALFWDDHNVLLPDQPAPTDPEQQGLGNDRVYACYEHYVHGLWRLFKHHADLFDGNEQYLNQNTDCSFDGGKTWLKLNANQLKVRQLPFARAIINGNQILVAASMPYAKPGQTTKLNLRYIENGYRFSTELTLNGDEIYLGRATMKK